jgi:atypical dual specificity phosphatase
MPFSRFDHSDVWSEYQEHNVHLVVLLTEHQEFLVYARKDLPDFYRSQDLDVLHLPVPDFGVPTDSVLWEEGLQTVTKAARNGKNVAIHCLAGVGRTGTFLACLAKKILGKSGIGAINWVREFVPGAMENPLQEEFVIRYLGTNEG